ncbi:MAG TPA: RICIN domain-containing protein [Steroidobacteraceae bacterium]
MGRDALLFCQSPFPYIDLESVPVCPAGFFFRDDASNDSSTIIGGPGYWRLRTAFTGNGKCLDIVNDGTNRRLNMATCGHYTGQQWIIEPIGTSGYWRLRTAFTGSNKCLDVVNDGKNDRLNMATCGNYTGQRWSLSAYAP